MPTEELYDLNNEFNSVINNQYDIHTRLLLHCNGSDGSTIFVDNSPSNHSITAIGDAQIDTAQKKFGEGSCLLDESIGSVNYLSIPDHADWHYGSEDFTIDCWVRFNTLPSAQPMALYSHFLNDNNLVYLYLINIGGNLYWNFYAKKAGEWKILLGNRITTININTWYHIAFVREGNIFRLFQNGIQLGANKIESNPIPEIAASLFIGAKNVGGADIDGWIDEYRISKGIARWTSNFTPPTNEYPSLFGIYNKFNTVRMEVNDINDKFNFVISNQYDLNNKFNTSIQKIETISNKFNFKRLVLVNINNKFETRKITIPNLINNFRMIAPWQKY